MNYKCSDKDLVTLRRRFFDFNFDFECDCDNDYDYDYEINPEIGENVIDEFWK